MVKQSATALDLPKSGSSPLRRRAAETPAKYFNLSIVTQYFPPDFAATGQLIGELAQHLQRQGLSVQVFTGQPGYAYEKQDAPKIERWGRLLVQRSRTSRLVPTRIRGKALNGLFFALRSALHLLKPKNQGDVLLLTTAPPFLPILGYFANLLFNTPYVCLLYDLYPDAAVELGVVSEQHGLVRLWTWLNCQAWKRAQSIIVLSSNMKDRIVAKCPEVADKVAIIHSWADPDTIIPIEKEKNWFAQEHDLVEPFTVLYSGNMGRCHDIDTILEAAIALRDEPIRFVFIGSGAKRKPCMERVAKLGLKNFLFLPYQDKACLPYSLTACDLSLVSVSEGVEGIVAPSKLYSALAAGRPIAAICESHSYLRQLLSDAGCGASFDNGDGAGLADFIRQLAEDRDQTKAMGKAGRNYLKHHFTPELIASQYHTVLRQVSDQLRQPVGRK